MRYIAFTLTVVLSEPFFGAYEQVSYNDFFFAHITIKMENIQLESQLIESQLIDFNKYHPIKM